MVWLGLHILTELPPSGQILMDCRHNPLLVFLAYLMACAGSFAMLSIAERINHVEHPGVQRHCR